MILNQLVNAIRARLAISGGEEPAATVARVLCDRNHNVVLDADLLSQGNTTHQAAVRTALGAGYRVAADVSNSDGTTLTTVLSVPVAANQSLRLDYFLNLFDGSGTGQLYLDMAIPSGASKIVFGSITELDEDASYTTHMFQAFPFDANGLSGFDSAHIFVSSISVIVNNGSTAGTVDLKFKASSNILTDVATVKKGSCVAVF